MTTDRRPLGHGPTGPQTAQAGDPDARRTAAERAAADEHQEHEEIPAVPRGRRRLGPGAGGA